MRLLKLSQWKVMTEFAIVMLEVSSTANLLQTPALASCVLWLRTCFLPSFAQSLCNSVIPQLFCDLLTLSVKKTACYQYLCDKLC